ncbi:hypothetical protein B566_EDAN013334 [Ephemera danica]|nr:hypothetical protein B566_EDAN013334 [Ephemera danica]
MKRIIGRKFDDPTVQSLIPRFCFTVNEDENGWPVVTVEKGEKRIFFFFFANHDSYKPEEISSLVLGEMRRLASVHLDSEVFDAVVTIPAYFNELQREATKRACAQAGLNVLRIINEPTAGAIAYGIQEPTERSRKILVFDFGGGTCDVSILQMEKNQYTVLSSHGDNKLGGEDFDDLLMDHLVQSFEKKHPGMKLDAMDKRRLRRQCERAKRELENHQSTEVVVKRITDSETSFRETVTRRKFQSLIRHLFPRVMNPVKQCLIDAKLKPSEVSEVVLVGGSSCMKSIQTLLQKHFPRVKLHRRINPDEAIAYGAAIQAAISSGQYGDNPPIIKDITPLSLGVEANGNQLSVLIAKNSQLPAKITKEFCTSGHLQSIAEINVYQGENPRANQNTLLGTFELNGLRRALAGMVKLDITFNINVDGILIVSAVEIGTSNAKQITINRSV